MGVAATRTQATLQQISHSELYFGRVSWISRLLSQKTAARTTKIRLQAKITSGYEAQIAQVDLVNPLRLSWMTPAETPLSEFPAKRGKLQHDQRFSSLLKSRWSFGFGQFAMVYTQVTGAFPIKNSHEQLDGARSGSRNLHGELDKPMLRHPGTAMRFTSSWHCGAPTWDRPGTLPRNLMPNNG